MLYLELMFNLIVGSSILKLNKNFKLELHTIAIIKAIV
jgi:hypothetical protein